MTGLTALGDVIGSLLARSPARWIVLSLLAAAIIGTAVYSYREINDELTAVTLSRREAVAQLAATVLAEKFERLVDVAVSLATRVRFRELVAQGKWAEAIEIMRAVPRDLPQIERLFLADIKGTLRADVPALPDVRGINFAHREWFKGVSREWRPYVSPVYIRQAAPQLKVFAVAAPIKDAAGVVTGILVLQIRIERLVEWVGAVGIGPEGSIYIVDSEGRLAFHSGHPNREEIVDLSKTPVVEKLRRGEQGAEIAFDPIEREDSVVAYASVPLYGWGVVAQHPVRASLGLAARDEQLRRLLTGYGLILLLGAVALFLASRVAVERQRAEDDRRIKAELERRVAERTTELTRTNELLRASEIRFRPVADTATDAIISADSRGRVVYFNKSAERIFGYTAEEILDQPLTRLMPPRFHEAHEQGLKRFITGGVSRVIGRTVELAGARKNGEEFPVELSLSTWKMDEKIFFTGLLRDITQRRQAEERIQQLNRDLQQRAAELEVINRELESFSYSVSHDLRAPLRSIDGFSQALFEDYPDRLDDQGRHYLARVRASTQRMAELIDDLLQLSRVTRAEMRRERVDLSALADSVVTDLRRTEPRRRVEVAIQPGLAAEGDPKLLHVVLQNLLSNAWKFTARTAHPRIEIGMQNQGGDRVFYVRDNGVGFDAAYAGKLFVPFQRLHTEGEFPGTGIGLATVQRIVHRHGGRVWAEGAVNQGATFYFALPSNGNA
jgi:PAS domain S-box-containing protein